MTDEDNLLTISGDADDSISLDASSGWASAGQEGGYDVYTASVDGSVVATLHIQPDVVIVE
jgi:phage-related baseplate assembly protein